MKIAGLKSRESAHEDSIWALTWIPATDDRPSLLLTGSLDETVRLWRPDDLSPVGSPVSGFSLGVVSVAAHPAGALAAAASLDSFVRVFDVESNSTIVTLESPTSEVWGMQFDPNGTILAVAGGSSASVKLWDTSTWQLKTTLSIPRPESTKQPNPTPTNKKFVLSVSFSPDGKRLACGSMDGTVSIFDVQRAKFLHHLPGHHMPVRTLAFSPTDPRVLFTGCDDANVHVYDSEGKALIGAMSGHASWVLNLDVSADGAALATGSSDRTVMLWDVGMRSCVQKMTGHADMVWGVAFRRGGGPGRLASVSDDKSVSLYDFS